jgi:DNA-binding phage protein
MTADEFIAYLRNLVEQVGSQTALAKQLGVSSQQLNDILTRRRPPQHKLLAALGFTRLITYVPPETPRKFTVAKKPLITR